MGYYKGKKELSELSFFLCENRMSKMDRDALLKRRRTYVRGSFSFLRSRVDC